jgi:hypothetical protein
MEILSAILLFGIPTVVLMGTLRLKGIMALLVLAPMLMLSAGVALLNTDPTITILSPVPANSTATQQGPQGFTTTTTSDVPNLVTHILITNSTNSLVINANVANHNFAGEHFTANSILIGEKIDTISMKVSKSGNPGGTYEIGIWDNSFTPKLIFCTPTANVLLTSPTFITCRLPVGTYYVIAADDYIGLSYINSAGSTGVNVFYVNTDYFDGTNSTKAIRNGTGVFSSQANEDVTIALLFNDVIGSITSVEVTVYDSVDQVTRTEFDSNDTGVTYTLEPKTMIVINGMSTTIGGILIFLIYRNVTLERNNKITGS